MTAASFVVGACVLMTATRAQVDSTAGPAVHVSHDSTDPAVTPGDSPVGNAERLSLRLDRVALNMHLNADTGAVTTRAHLRVRNGGTAPLLRVALQVSSALQWQSARLVEANGSGTRLSLQQFHVTTDTDHTGAANEVVLTLPKPLPVGSGVSLDLFYGGTLAPSAERLVRLGAPDDRAIRADWDGVAPAFTGLRGFGNVLWYPVAAPAALLADGDRFAQAVTAERERTTMTMMELSLTLEHTGAATETAWFLGRSAALVSPLRRREAVTASEEKEGAPASDDGGTAAETDPEQTVIETAQWEPMRLDGRPVSLFVTDGGEAVAGSSGEAVGIEAAPSPAPVDASGIRVVGGDVAVRQTYRDAAAKILPLLKQWLPVSGGAPLTVLALPSPGTQAFADGSLLVAPLRTDDTAALAEALVYPIAAAALPEEAPPWMREGLPEFLRLLYLEQTTGRDRMLAELGAAVPLLQQAEAERGMDPAPLRTCVDPVCARNKGAYALIMLRGMAGDAALEQALQAVLLPQDTGATDGRAITQRFEAALTQSSGKDFDWFFADWFRADRGLPDLQIVQVAPRRVERGGSSVVTPSSRRPVAGPIGAEPEAEADDPRRNSTTAASRNTEGLPEGSWLVAVEVQNNGDAAAEVPVTVRAASLQNQLPLRIPAHGRATIRVPFETAPEQVLVNDGTIPEQHGTVHRRTIEVTR